MNDGLELTLMLTLLALFVGLCSGYNAGRVDERVTQKTMEVGR